MVPNMLLGKDFLAEQKGCTGDVFCCIFLAYTPPQKAAAAENLMISSKRPIPFENTNCMTLGKKKV